MIFVSLGSQKFPFDRLLKALDEQVMNEQIKDEIFAQTGYSNYVPAHYDHVDFLDNDRFLEKIAECQIVICHGGTGAITSALKKGKKVIAVPRLAAYGEHVDDHQRQICEEFAELDLIMTTDELDKLPELIDEIKGRTFATYQSNTATIIASIEDYIDNGR